eukprot:6984040-Karenia_brevis.AAC.1
MQGVAHNILRMNWDVFVRHFDRISWRRAAPIFWYCAYAEENDIAASQRRNYFSTISTATKTSIASRWNMPSHQFSQ